MTYILAEIGNNHDGDHARALNLIDLAAQAGANGVKFQMFRAEHLVTPDLPAMVGTGTQFERLERLEFEEGEWHQLIARAHERRVDFLASVFDEGLMATWGRVLDGIKIASGDVTHIGLIRAAAETGKPIIISAGLASEAEVRNAIHGLNRDRLTLLHCVSRYPCPPELASLGRMEDLRRLHSRVGYSCHVVGVEACVAAAAMGAVMIEKHFTDETRDYGDHVHSATPDTLADMVTRIRQVERMRESCYMPPSENRRKMMRGAYAARDIKKGETLGEDAIVALRPRVGRWPWDLRGMRAQRDYSAGEGIE